MRLVFMGWGLWIIICQISMKPFLILLTRLASMGTGRVLIIFAVDANIKRGILTEPSAITIMTWKLTRMIHWHMETVALPNIKKEIGMELLQTKLWPFNLTPKTVQLTSTVDWQNLKKEIKAEQ